MVTSLSKTNNQIFSTEEITALLQETITNYLKKRIELTVLIDIVAEIEKYHKSALNPKLKRIIMLLHPALIQDTYARERVNAILKELTDKKE